MSSRGAAETQQLQERLELQLERLVLQLAEIEECKDDFEPSEYEETKKETMEQLQEFNESLSKMTSGDMTLVDRLGMMQLAIQSAISAAFQTPSVLRAFIRKEPEQLRQRLSELERDIRLGKIAHDLGSRQKVEILQALKQLGEILAPPEQHFLESYSAAKSNFVQVTGDAGVREEEALAIAGSQLRSMNSS